MSATREYEMSLSMINLKIIKECEREFYAILLSLKGYRKKYIWRFYTPNSHNFLQKSTILGGHFLPMLMYALVTAT